MTTRAAVIGDFIKRSAGIAVPPEGIRCPRKSRLRVIGAGPSSASRLGNAAKRTFDAGGPCSPGRAPYTQFSPAPSRIKEWSRLDFLRRLSITDTFVQ